MRILNFVRILKQARFVLSIDSRKGGLVWERGVVDLWYRNLGLEVDLFVEASGSPISSTWVLRNAKLMGAENARSAPINAEGFLCGAPVNYAVLELVRLTQARIYGAPNVTG
jgi:hypothetical protein